MHHDLLIGGFGRHPGQTGAETDWSMSQRGSGAGRRRRGAGRDAARRTAFAAAGEHLPGPAGQGTGETGHRFVRYADDFQVYVGGATAANRVVRNLPKWIAKHLRPKVNARKSGVRPWERVPGLPDHPAGADRSGPGEPEAAEVTGAPSGTPGRTSASPGLRDQWRRYIRGWWGYYRLAEWRRPVGDLEGWIRRHIRKCFWTRWHSGGGVSGDFGRWGYAVDCCEWPIAVEGAGESPGTGRCTRP